MRIIEFLKENSLFDANAYTYPEFLDADLRTMLDGVVLSRFGFRELQDRVRVFSEETDYDIAETVHLLVYTLSLEKDYKWKTLFSTEHFEYNPIENYDRNEHEEITRSKGSQENASVYGAQQNSTEYGATSATTADAAHTDTTTNETSAENAVVYQPNEKSTAEYGATSTTATTTTHTDTVNNGTHTDTFSEGSREDGEERDLRVHGNIGTVTGQDMIKQEREIADFDALLEIAHDIVLEIGKGVL